MANITAECVNNNMASGGPGDPGYVSIASLAWEIS